MTKAKVRKAIVTAALGIFLGGGIFESGLASGVRAQEVPTIRDLSVISSGNGVSARCEFEGYGADSSYSMELYLNQVKEDGTVNEIALKGILPSADGSGVEMTGEEQVEPGVYKATLVLDRTDGGALQVDNFRNSLLYDVIRNGDKYEVMPHQEKNDEQGSENGTKEPSVAEEKAEEAKWPNSWNGRENDTVNTAEQSICDHSAIDLIVKAADPENDAVLAGECSKCGEVLAYSFMPNSAYAAFLENAVNTIQNTQAGEAVIETGRWISFNQSVFEAIAEHPEVAVTVRYRYGGKRYEVTIPAGAEVNDLTDENGFCGFRYLDQIFNGKEIVE